MLGGGGMVTCCALWWEGRRGRVRNNEEQNSRSGLIESWVMLLMVWCGRESKGENKKAAAVVRGQCMGKATSHAWGGTDKTMHTKEAFLGLDVVMRSARFHHPPPISCPVRTDKSNTQEKKRKRAMNDKIVPDFPCCFFLLFVSPPHLAYHTSSHRSPCAADSRPAPHSRFHHPHHHVRTTTMIASCFSFAVLRFPFLPFYLHSPRGAH
jgi:hypothetical protein